jgi:plastocyanin
MKRKSLLLPLCAAALLGCSGDSEPVDPGAGALTVAVRNNLFAPATLQVPANSTVMWEWNSGGVDHNVTFDTGPSSGNRSSGTFERTFPTAGTFPYSCTIHGAQVMSGVVNVATATGGGGGSGGGGGGSYP